MDANVKAESDVTVPKSIGIIIDGNRRWAKEHGSPSFEGHRKGYEKVTDFFTWAREAGVEEITVYAFSTENWKRTEEEVSYLMKLVEELLETKIKDLEKEQVRVRFIGDYQLLSEKIQKRLLDAEERTKNFTNGVLAIAFSYGGRQEILSAVNRVLEQGREVVTQTELRDAMWSAGLLDPDLIIRTGGEKRLSNFLTWQSTYSELFFTDTKWPAFTKEEFLSMLEEYAQRERRHGK